MEVLSNTNVPLQSTVYPTNIPWPCAPTVPNHSWFAEYAILCPTLMPRSRQLPQPAKSPFSYLALGCHLNCYCGSEDFPGNPGKIYWSPCYASASQFPYLCSDMADPATYLTSYNCRYSSCWGENMDLFYLSDEYYQFCSSQLSLDSKLPGRYFILSHNASVTSVC